MERHVPDPRAQALADYLRDRAAAFSLSADSTGEQLIATAGMALLDAAAIVELLPATDHRLAELSRAGRFEAMPDGAARFLESPEVRAVVLRPLSGSSLSGREIFALLVATACER